MNYTTLFRMVEFNGGELRHGAAHQLADQGWGLAIGADDEDVFLRVRELLEALGQMLPSLGRPSPLLHRDVACADLWRGRATGGVALERDPTSLNEDVKLRWTPTLRLLEGKGAPLPLVPAARSDAVRKTPKCSVLSHRARSPQLPVATSEPVFVEAEFSNECDAWAAAQPGNRTLARSRVRMGRADRGRRLKRACLAGAPVSATAIRTCQRQPTNAARLPGRICQGCGIARGQCLGPCSIHLPLLGFRSRLAAAGGAPRLRVLLAPLCMP